MVLARALVNAPHQVAHQPETVWPIMEQVMGFNQQVIADAWHLHEYKGTLAPDLLEVLAEEEIWLAEIQGRVPRSRVELAQLIDASILEEALRSL